MKKVNRKFLEEQVKLVLTEQEQEQQTGCVPVNEDPGFWSWQMLFSLFFGSPESYKTIGKDLGRRFTWGTSAGSQYLEAAQFSKLKSPDSYIFRFLEPVKADGLTYVGSVKLREEIFKSFDKVIKFYAPKFSKVNLKAKGTTLGVFGEESLEELYQEFIEKVEQVEEKYGLDDPELQDWTWLRSIGVKVDYEATKISRNSQATEEGLKQLAKNMRKFLSTPRSISEIQKRLENDIMLGIGDIYIRHGIRSFKDIYNYIRSNQKGGKLLDMINAASYQKKIKETPVFASYADVIGSLALLLTTGGAASAGAKAAGKVGTRAALARGMAKTAQVTGMPRKAALSLIGALEKKILAKVESSILQTAAKVSTGSAKIATKVTFALPRFLAETSMTMGLVTDKMNFQLGKYQKLFVQYENLIKNQKIDKDALPSDSDTIEVFSMLGDTVKAAVSDETGETQDNSQKIEDKKQFLVLKSKLEKDLLETFDAIETASYAEFGGLLKECGVPYAGLVEEEKEIRRNIIISSFKESDPDKVTKVHMAFIADVSRYVEDLNTYHAALKEKTQELQSKTSDLGQGFSDLDKIKNNIGIEKPSFISSDESQATQAPATPSATTKVQTSFGSNEKTSSEILRDLEDALSKIQESQDSDVISVNIGYKDALEFAKGNKEFSPEKTKANIDKIIALIQSKGKKANITPVAALADTPEGVDKNKFDDFSKSINSYIQTKKVSTAKPTQTTQTPTPADKPTGDRQVTQGKDVSDVSGPEILIIGDSTSHNIVVANPILKRGEHQKIMGYVDGNGKKVPYIKKANGEIDYWATKQKSIKLGGDGKPRFPGYSGHASHGGAGTTYIKNSLDKLLARDESYVPKVAIISMGYNDPPSVSKKGTSINNFKSIISALKERGVKDIRIIEPRADKGSYKRNADLIRPGVYDLADSVVKIVPNPTTQDGGPPRSDGVHYTPDGARRLFKDAMSGLTVSSDIQQSSGVSTASKPERQAPTLRQNLKSVGVELDPRVEKLYYQFGKKATGFEPNQFDLHAQGISQLETAENSGAKRYTHENSVGYLGKYQLNGDWWYTTLLSRIRKDHGLEDLIPEGDIGYAEPEQNRKHKPASYVKKDEKRYGKRLSYKQFAKEFVKKDMWQIQELLWAAMQANNSERHAHLDQRTRSGFLAIAHNVGDSTARAWVEAKKQYLSSNDPRYLMKMWSMQDGYRTPAEKFLRNSARRVYGSEYIKLPSGKQSVYADIYARETGKPKPRFGATFGKQFNPKDSLDVYKEYWNRSTNNTDIYKYYKKDGTPNGSDGSLVAGTDNNIGEPSGTTVSSQASEPAAKSVDLVAAAKEVQSFQSLASYVYDILDTQGQNLKGIDRELNDIAGDVDNTNLASFKKNADTILKNIHKRRLPRIEAEFRRDIAAAGDDREKLELANKKVAYFHRPMFYSTVNVRNLKTMGTSEVSFAFEPGRNRASVNFDGGVEFYKQDYQDGGEMNKFITKLREISNALEILLEKLNEFSRSESDRLRDIQVYQKSLSALKKVLDKVTPIISDSTETALRRSYATTVLNAALRKL